MNKIINKSCLDMQELKDSCIDLVITSPPYNVGKEYEKTLSMSEYEDFLYKCFLECFRVMKDGARICVNVANIGRKPYVPLSAKIHTILEKVGFLARGEIIWNKAASVGGSTAWGSWMSASNPTLRDVHEYILVYSKATFAVKKGSKEDSISRESFLEYTKSIWDIKTESAKKIGHPAPFPVEIPSRLIELYSFVGDTVLDPFMGSGTTAVAAKGLKRNYFGYETEDRYIAISEGRLNGLIPTIT